MKYRYFLLLVSLLTFFHYGFIQWQVDETIPPTQAMFRATLLSSKNNQKINLHQLNNDPPYDWLTFIESDMCETGYGAELDSSGNLYVLTNRYVSEDCLIQLPMENEIFTTKISSDGNVLSEISVDTDPFSWSESITLDNEDNLYISGTSGGSWGEPLSPFSGDEMVFIAKYDTSNSSILWNTFLGTNIFGWSDVTSDKNNDIYAVWSQFNNNVDTSHYLAKLNSEGILQWSKVIIPNGDIDETSFSVDVLVDQNINIYVLSTHIFDWGSPVREQAGGYDASLAKFDSTGELLWNTFLGGTGDDVGSTVKIDENGFLYVSGYSDSTWGNPINIYQPGTDGFLAKLDLDGTLLWNTFLGGRTGRDLVPDMEIGVDGNLYLAGSSESSWGNPENAFSTIRDGFVAQFDSNGSLLWNTFIGGNDDDVLGRIELDNRNEIRVTGVSFGSFGNPITPPQGGGNDIFAASISIAQVSQNSYRDPGPLVPMLTTYIPTPLDISTDPSVIGANILLAIVLMLPFAVAVNSFSQIISENEENLMRWVPPLAWIKDLQSRSKEPAKYGSKLKQNLLDVLSLFGVALFYGIVFSLLDETWQPFTAQGLVLLGSMTFSCGVIGFLSDILQWRALRKWEIPAEYNLRAASIFLSTISVGISRSLTLLPGLMFGYPEILKVDEKLLNERQNQSLIRISSTTFLVIALGAWLPTIATTLIQRSPISDSVKEIVGGVEAFLLVIFAVALECIFLELLALSEGLGTKLKRFNRRIWVISLILCTFFFLHTLLNPRYDLIGTLKQGNVTLFIWVVVAFIALTFGLRMISRSHEKKIESS